MSETDSDLDYASADEDASCDVSAKNNNMNKVNHPDVNNESLPSSGHPSEIMSDISDASNRENLCKEDSKTDSINRENAQVTGAPDDSCCDHANEHFSVKDSIKDELLKDPVLDRSDKEKAIKDNSNDFEESKNNSLDSSVKEEKKYEPVNKSLEDNVPESTKNKVHEKQRVPLRLEKKIQQKQQASKEESVDTEEIKATEFSSKNPDVKSSSWGFGSWGTNLLSTAASSVSTFTNQVSQGIGTVLETVENTLGAPSPEELATALKNKKESSDSPLNNVDESNSNFESKEEVTSDAKSGILPSVIPNVSTWTKVLEDTGSKVIMGGLDTLELIGKKTIDIITEGDPGLRKKRAAFADGITLSQILREAKAEADESKQDEDPEKDTVHYSQIFDEYQGLVHLEALEMLSKQSEAKIQMLLMRTPRNSEVRKNLEEIKSICENIPQFDDPAAYEDFEDFLTLCKKYVLELNITFNVENIIKTQKRINDVLKNYENATVTTNTPEEIYHSAICSLAEFTAKSMEAFHKLAELMLVQPSLEPNVEHFATNLTGLTTVMCIEINKVSARYHHCLDSISEQYENDSSQKVNITTVVTNLYLEAGNSNKYIQDAFMLLVPVLQACLLESS